MKLNFKTTFLVFLCGFALFFLLRLTYGYVIYPNGEKLVVNYGHLNSRAQFSNYKSTNIAGQSTKLRIKTPSGKPLAVDQRYEKIANMSIASEEFEDDSKQLRKTIKSYEALVQYEQSNGLPGSRSIKLALGVNPRDFDKIIDDLKKLAKLQSLQVNKTDKTNEYKSLQATQISLTKSRDALLKLKSHDAKVAELIGLEDRILQIEQRIQELGVNLGEFDSENEFVTVKLTLYEIATTKLRNINILARTFTAIVWAVKYYGLFVLTFMGFLLCALAGVKTIEILRRVFTTQD